jgi:hypothetical protein
MAALRHWQSPAATLGEQYPQGPHSVSTWQLPPSVHVFAEESEADERQEHAPASPQSESEKHSS